MVTHETNALSAPGWIDTHAHLDAAELLGLQGFDFIEKAGAISSTHVDGLAQTHREQQLLMHTLQKATEGVALGVIPAVERANFDTVQALAHGIRWGYGLGIHPMYTPQAAEPDLEVLAAALDAAKADPHLVAVGEIGLDLFVPALKEPTALAKQEAFYRAQLKLARNAGLPVILHVRRSADLLLKHLRQISVQGGIAHSTAASRKPKPSSIAASSSALAARLRFRTLRSCAH
jgi:Tat protein secretion system quality control protein TatD with DNase activity